MPDPGSESLTIEHLGQVPLAQAAVRGVAEAVGFDPAECERIALAATELATNLVTHGGGGTFRVAAAQDGERTGVELLTEDTGPGISDVGRALTDGYSTAGGLGLGLGTVHRLMDDLEFASGPRGGLRVLSRRWLRRAEERPLAPLLDCGVATRPRQGAPENGDAFVLRYWGNHALLGVLDGLGHGEWAQRAAQQARAFIEAHYDQPLDRLFAGVDTACRRTRGLVMALAHFDLGAHRFEFASVGNIEARLFGAEGGRDFVVRRGILGVNAPSPVVTTHAWTATGILVLHSDGLSSRWQRTDFPLAVWDHAPEAAHQLLLRLGKPDDDATVLVVKDARSR